MNSFNLVSGRYGWTPDKVFIGFFDNFFGALGAGQSAALYPKMAKATAAAKNLIKSSNTLAK